MNVNKKFNRLRQWGKERMGAEIKSGSSEDFKALENEMNMRNEGLERMHLSMTAYVKSLNKRIEIDSREKITAIASLGSTMAKHGEIFDDDSKFGQCLTKFGLANQRIARAQDTFATQASGTWLDALERSIVQMKEYNNARKRLESRRLAYDTSVAKVQKAKKEDYRAEEEVRSQKAKFEESTEDVQRRMNDILESEQNSLSDLQSFFDAELAYHERCREILLHIRKDWPLQQDSDNEPDSRRRNRTPGKPQAGLTTTQSSLSINSDDDATVLPLPKPAFRSSSRSSSSGSACSKYLPGLDRRANLTSAKEDQSHDEDDTDASSSPDQQSFWENSHSTRSTSPATSVTLDPISRSRKGSWSATESIRTPSSQGPNQAYEQQHHQQDTSARLPSVSGTVKKIPPPPPPSRSAKSKPPPPPPPMKRSALSTTAIPSNV